VVGVASMHVEYHDTTPCVNCATTQYHAGMDTFADFVRARRETLGMTGVDLATQADLTKSEVSAIENGRIKLPGADKRRRLARALRMRHVDLLVAAGELAPDEVPGTTQTAPASDPTRDRLEHLLAQFDLGVDNRAVTLLGIFQSFVAQDQQRRSVVQHDERGETAG
jgi:transcriptional regulator with XRE-family HTH domain